MTYGTTTFNVATTAGDRLLNDELDFVDGGAAPAQAKVQVSKMAWGGTGVSNSVSEALPLPIQAVAPTFWRVGFAESGPGLQGLAAQEMTLVQTGAGMTVNQSGGNLVVTTGTTANSETVFRSNLTFRGALLARYKAILSQRIANQTFRFELADLLGTGLAYTINSATSVTVTFSTNPFTPSSVGQFVRLSCITGAAGIPGRYAIASVGGNDVTFTVAGWPATGTGTLTAYGHNWLANEYSGTVATNSSFDCQRRGWASGNTTATINTTASPGHVGQINFDVLAAGFADSLVASNAGYQWANRASRIENIPDEDVNLHFFLVVQNGSTAPASTTTLTVGFMQVEDQPRQKVRLASSDPAGSHPTPVHILGSATIPVTQNVATNLRTEATVVGYPAAAALADNVANPTLTQIAAAGLLFNNVTWDRARGNIAATAEASSAKTASGNTATAISNFNGRGVVLLVNVTAVSGTTPSLVVRLQVQDPTSSNWVDVPGAATAAITATTGTTPVLLTIYPGMTAVANSVVNFPLARTWRVAWTITGTTPSFTFSVGYQLIL